MATCSASNYVWSQWTDHGTDCTAELYTDTWSNWTTTVANNSGPTTGDIVWIQWNEPSEYSREVEVTYHDNTGKVIWNQWVDAYDAPSLEVYRDRAQKTVDEATEKLKKWKVPSAETLRAQKAQQDIRRIWNQLLADEKKAERETAENVALELLLDIVSDEEFARYKETGQLFVKGKRNDYVIKKDGQVYKVDKNKVVDFAKKKKAEANFICVHPKNRYSYPDTDNVITLKLWIENNEKKFLKIGNIHSRISELDGFDKVVGL